MKISGKLFSTSFLFYELSLYLMNLICKLSFSSIEWKKYRTRYTRKRNVACGITSLSVGPANQTKRVNRIQSNIIVICDWLGNLTQLIELHHFESSITELNRPNRTKLALFCLENESQISLGIRSKSFSTKSFCKRSQVLFWYNWQLLR